jgi:hypothetical protein
MFKKEGGVGGRKEAQEAGKKLGAAVVRGLQRCAGVAVSPFMKKKTEGEGEGRKEPELFKPRSSMHQSLKSSVCNICFPCLEPSCATPSPVMHPLLRVCSAAAPRHHRLAVVSRSARLASTPFTFLRTRPSSQG